MRGTFIQRWRRLCCLSRNQRGGPAVELALTFSWFMISVLFLIEIALIYFLNTALEGGLRQAARLGVTGQMTEQARQDEIVRLINTKLAGVFTINRNHLRTAVYPSFGAVQQPEPLTVDLNNNAQFDPGDSFTDINGNGVWDRDQGRNGSTGAAEQIVLYEINFSWPLINQGFANLMGTTLGTIPVRASLVVRNEPYQT